MNDFKQILYVIFAIVAGLILIYWLGQGIAWNKTRADNQRAICVTETHNPEFCQVQW